MSSEYEQNVGKLLIEKDDKLRELRKNNESNKEEIERLMTEVETLQSLFDNYNLGMNYFRRARGGRSGLRE
jgi:colicin import membrane protein